MSTPALNPLVEKIRTMHPGAYDDMDDAALTKAVLAKYPQYSDLAAPSASQAPGAPPSRGGAPMQQEPLTWLQKRGAQTAENAVDVAQHVAPMAKQAANDLYDSSAPNIATELMKRLQGQPNKLHEIPAKAVMTWLAAGGIPEGESGEAATAAKPAEASATRPTEVPPVKHSVPAQSADQATASAEAPTALPFPPPKPKGKFQYDPARVTPKDAPRPGPTFDTNGITRDVDEDNAIEDAMRADLTKHGTIARMQANREFAAKNSMDTAKGVLQERAQNTLAAPSLIDAGTSKIGSVSEPVEFLNGTKAYKTGGQWLVQKGTQWQPVTKSQMKDLVTAAKASAASSAPKSEDLTEEWSRALADVKAKKGR